MSKKSSLFPWLEDVNKDLAISVQDKTNIAHEIMYEGELNKLPSESLFLGQAIPKYRYLIAVLLIILMVIVLLVNSFLMQYVHYDKYALQANQNRLRFQYIVPSRGIIRDRNNVILASNTPTFDIVLMPIDLPITDNARNDLFGLIARITHRNIKDLTMVLSNLKGDLNKEVVIARDIPYEQAIALQISLNKDIDPNQAIKIRTGEKRKYPLSEEFTSFSHILGYVGRITQKEYEEKNKGTYTVNDLIGKSGIESVYENVLRGKFGKKIIEVNARGIEKKIVDFEKPVSGQDIHLTIDADFQKQVESILKEALEKDDLKKGTVIALNPQNGEILAAVSYPSFNNNLFSGRVDPQEYKRLLTNKNKPLLARAWAGLYPSGSTIKPIYSVALLAEKIITPYTQILSTGGIKIGQSFFPDWKAGGHGLTNVRRAIAWSVNSFFYITCGGYHGFKGLGVSKMDDWLYRFGFGKQTGLDVIGESSGFVPSPEWKKQKLKERWYVGDTYNLSIGQGALLVTPIQLVVATAEIANGGYKIVPHFLKSDQKNKQGEKIASATIVNVVRQGMRDTVVYGSGRALSGLSFKVSGKTGTAQWRKDAPNHAWFTAFAPYKNPKIAVVVLLEEGEEGSRTAVPVAKMVLEAWNNIFNK